MKPFSFLIVGLIISWNVHAQDLPPKIQVCIKAAQIAGDIARFKMQSKNYTAVDAFILSSGLPGAQMTRLRGLLDTVWSSVRDAQEANARLNPAQIQNDYYLNCTQ
jgi:hypothetical protein